MSNEPLNCANKFHGLRAGQPLSSEGFSRQCNEYADRIASQLIMSKKI